MSLLDLIICTGLLAISGFLSASEIAIFSLSRFQLRQLKERFRPQHRTIKRLLADPAGLLIIILVVNETVNISLSAIITHSVSRSLALDPQLGARLTSGFGGYFSGTPLWAVETILGLTFTAPVVLLLGEITPKVIAARANQIVAPMTVGPLAFTYDFLKPVRVSVQYFVNALSKTVSRKPAGNPHAPQPSGNLLREEDFLVMVEEGHREGAIQLSEMEMIRSVFDLDNTLVAEIQTPMSRVSTMPENTTLAAAFTALTQATQYWSRIPVMNAAKTKVTGILYSKDLLVAKLEKEDPSTPISALMGKLFTVTPTTPLNILFRRMKKQKTHMALVENDRGVAVGIVTMTDVLDALFEELVPAKS